MVSFEDTTPIYLQIAEEVRSSILDGSLAEGDRLTSTTEYATTYRINPATANKAVALLVDEGLVVKRRGVGMFVADGAAESLRTSRRAQYMTAVLAPALEAGLVLGLRPAALLDAAGRHLAAGAPGQESSSPEGPSQPGAPTYPPNGPAPEASGPAAVTAARPRSPSPARSPHNLQEQS